MVKCYICWKECCSQIFRQFHSFPQDAKRREKWVNSIGYIGNVSKHAKVCSDHFTEDDYYYCDTPKHSRRLKKTAIPSVFTKSRFHRNVEKNSISNIQNDNQHESLMDIKQECTMDIKHEYTMDIEHEYTIDIKHEYTMDIQPQSINDVQPHSTKEIQSQSTNDIQPQSTKDIQPQSTKDIQLQSTKDIQQSALGIQHDITSLEPILVKKNNTISRKRKRDINDMEKVFVKTGKYNIECIKKTEFVTNQAWMKFVKYVHYNRYLHKLSMTQTSMLLKKIVIMQSVEQTLRNKNLVTNDV